ncbi:hypothetical protein FACS1894198_2470 [Clostridia bacterium]|nr:hypothetical protein FACS1894198_2470 [Clostridia bacterium]
MSKILYIALPMLVGAVVFLPQSLSFVVSGAGNENLVCDNPKAYSKADQRNSTNIPFINIDSENARKVNKELEEYVKKIHEGYDLDGPCYTNVDYSTYLNGDILSLKVFSVNGGIRCAIS